MTETASERLLIRGAHLLTQDPALGELVGDVLVADGRIERVGAGIVDDRAVVVDGAGHAVLPGFVDTHRHAWQGALRSTGPEWTYAEYRDHVQIGLGPYLEPGDVHIGNTAADLMSLDAGVTNGPGRVPHHEQPGTRRRGHRSALEIRDPRRVRPRLAVHRGGGLAVRQ